MDRAELIKALGAAFTDSNDANNGPGMKVESAMAGDKKVLRVSEIKENSPMFELQHSYPDAFVVSELIDRLEQTGEKTAVDTARELQVKLEAAATKKDGAKIEEMIAMSREVKNKILGTSPTSQQRAIVYMFAQDRVKNL